MTWSERVIGNAICQQLLQRRCVVMVPNCGWTGSECDILAITTDLRVIDIEVKISRADLKRDAAKDKWWRRKLIAFGEEVREHMPDGRVKSVHKPPVYDEKHLEWPRKVWKHYFAMPADIWTPDLVSVLPSTASGVLLLRQRPAASQLMTVVCERRAKPCRDAERLTPEQVVDVARLANLRMWDAYMERERARGKVAA